MHADDEVRRCRLGILPRAADDRQVVRVRDEAAHRLRGLDVRHPVQALRQRCGMAPHTCPDVNQRATWLQPGLEPAQEPVLLGANREGEAASSTAPPIPIMVGPADLRLPCFDQTPPMRCPIDVKHCVHRPYLALAHEPNAVAVTVSAVDYRSSACATSSRW